MSHLFAVADNTGAFSLWGPICTGVVVYLLNQHVTTHFRRSRLKNVILVDCIETLQRLSNEYPTFRCHRPTELTLEEDFGAVRNHPNGFVVAGPMQEPKELVTLLRQAEARVVVRYYERWELFMSLEERFTVAYQRLLEASAKACHSEQVDSLLLKEEYWQQVKCLLALMNDTGREVCLFACKVFRCLAPFNELELEENSCNRWKTWQEFEAEKERYESPDAKNT